MTFQHIEEWFEVFRQFGYLPGFVLLYLRAVIPVLPLVLYILLNMHAYGPVVGIVISWLGLIAGTFSVYLIFKQLTHTAMIQRFKSRKIVQKLIAFIDKQGLVPLFILLCFPFTPNTLVNVVASMSNIKVRHYFLILTVSKLITTAILGLFGKEIMTITAHPIKGGAMLIGLIVLWFVSKKLEKHYLGSK